MEAFLEEYPNSNAEVIQLARQLGEACTNHSKDQVMDSHRMILVAIESSFLIQQMNDFFDKSHAQSPLFTFAKQYANYMQMVSTVFLFIRASREGLWDLHLSSLDALCKYFFAYDRLNYARMVPLYLADMNNLKTSDPDIWLEFESGNFIVNKTSVLFCSSNRTCQSMDEGDGWLVRHNT